MASKVNDIEKSKEEARNILIEKSRDTVDPLITYAELADSIKSLSYGAWSSHFGRFLTKLSIDEHHHGRPLISALVVDKTRRIPNSGFWDLARSLGLLSQSASSSEEILFWVKEIDRIKTFSY